ncbi:MAG: hypothetical protein HEQ16_07575 [Bosea sp.]|jgi:hypothetical protein|nr:hypothetical protein [Bosea sp. (in: a-proteobacteria)]
MANNAPAYGSGRHTRPDPLIQIGPARENERDPVAAAPAALIDWSAPLKRLEGVRIIREGAAWQGVGLRLQSHDPASMLFEVFLTAGGGRNLVVAVIDEDEAVAVWRSIGRSTGLPLLLMAADGSVCEPYPQLGAVALGPFHMRRQHSFLRHRRPRFLARRKAARFGIGPVAVNGVEMSGGGR